MSQKNTILIYGIGVLALLVIIRTFNFNPNINKIINFINVVIIVALFFVQQEILIEYIKSIFRIKK